MRERERVEETYNRDSPLVTGDDGTTNGLRSNLGHVHNDNGGDETNTETGDDTTTDEETDGGGGDLKDDTDGEDETCDNDGETTTDPIRKGTTEESAKEGTGGENGGDQTCHRIVSYLRRGGYRGSTR